MIIEKCTGRKQYFVNLGFFFVTGEECPIPMDTTFIVDSSGCASRRNWTRLLNFLQTIVSFFNVSPSGGRVAVIQFSTQANVDLKFNTLTGSLLNGAEVNRQMSRLRCQRGFRRIDRGLEVAGKEVLTSEGGLGNNPRVNASASLTILLLLIP